MSKDRAILSILFYGGRAPGDNCKEVGCSFIEGLADEMGWGELYSFQVSDRHVWDRESMSMRVPKNAPRKYELTVAQLQELAEAHSVTLDDLRGYIDRKRSVGYGMEVMNSRAKRAFGLQDYSRSELKDLTEGTPEPRLWGNFDRRLPAFVGKRGWPQPRL